MALGLFFVIVLGVIAWAWLRSQAASQRGPALAKLALAAGILLFSILAVTGRLHIAGLILALTYPLLRRYLPVLLQQAKPSGARGNESSVRSDILEMTLDHDTGTMSGRILKGPFEGRDLQSLEEDEFLSLLRYCRSHDDGSDNDSARLLETYLDRRFGESWRTDDPGSAEAEGREEEAAQKTHRSGDMSRSEAYEILGLEPGASRDEITQAHRRLMQRMHPDRGGSAYLAARINAARKLLLD